MSRAGGVDFPAEAGGLIALTEVVVHGWDVARATGQPCDIDSESANPVLAHVAETAAAGRVNGLSGRRSGWPTTLNRSTASSR